MVKYWASQHLIDVMIGLVLTIVAVHGPKIGVPVLLTLSLDDMIVAARTWVGPALTLLGMMSATTAFIFSVVDKPEFGALRTYGVERQLWNVFSENLFWLAVTAISLIVLTFMKQSQFSDIVLSFASFLFFMVTICVLKFAWVMRQIISVRASK